MTEPTAGQKRELDRLIEEEERERAERRGIEARMTGLIASSLVALGLIVNAVALTKHGNGVATGLLIGAGSLVVAGLLWVTTLKRKPESFREWRSQRDPTVDTTHALSVPRLAEEDPDKAICAQHQVIVFLREQNRKRLRGVHKASQAFFLAVLVIFIGAVALLVL